MTCTVASVNARADPTYDKERMPTEILMPALSPTMEEGKLAKWLIKEGQQVKAGDIIAEIETDKATMEVEAVDEGKVGRLLVEAGTEGVKVNTPIATLLAEGESEGAARQAEGADAASCARHVRRRRRQRRAASASAASSSSTAGDGDRAQLGDGRRSFGRRAARSLHERIFASPLARRLAKAAGIEIGGAGGLGSARPRRQARRRERARQRSCTATAKAGTAMTAQEAARHPPRSRRCRACRTTRSWRCTTRAPTRSCRTTACAR